MISNNLSNIIFESINEDYGYAMYGPFKVIIMKKNGHVNATKLCADGGKQFKHWLENKQSQEIINYYEKPSVDFPTDEKIEANSSENNEIDAAHFRTTSKSIIIVTGGQNTTVRGTYIDQRIIPAVAIWCSVEFYDKVQRIINEYIVSEYKKQLEQKDGHIDYLGKDVVVKAEDNRKKQNFHLIRFNGCVAPRYKIIRGQKANISRQYKFLDEKNLNYTILMRFEDIPHGVNYGNRLKERLGIKFCEDMTFVLPSQYDELFLKIILQEVHEERFFQ